MKIVIFSINPIYPEVVTGGASKHLFHIASHLGAKGHSVEILCAEADTINRLFTWAENVRVLPVLPFNLPFPQPYAVSGPELALITERLRAVVCDADRFYIHDGEWLIPDVYQDIPTVSSFRDNIYPESVLGTFLTKADEVICVSPYSAVVIEHTAGRFFPKLKNRIHQVNNGIDFNQFTHQDPSFLARELSLDPDQYKILLHPHRPEPGKGLSETIHVAARLVHKAGISTLRVLVPAWIEGMVSSGENAYHRKMLRLMEDLGVREHFDFIPWLPNNRMPELYSLGAATLCLGNIVEAFGNVAYESLACGTPSVVARVGVHRSLLPDDLISKIHPGDTDAAVSAVLEILNNRPNVNPATLSFLQEQMDFNQQIGSYVEIIENCSKRERLQFLMSEPCETQAFQLAPWCYLDGERIYHDFHRTFAHVPELAKLLRERDTITKSFAYRLGVSEKKWETWLDRTWIVPQSQ